MNFDKTMTRQIRILTYSGVLPPLIFALLPEDYFISVQIQTLILSYIAMIIAFLSGNQWVWGLVNRLPLLNILSILQALMVWLIIQWPRHTLYPLGFLSLSIIMLIVNVTIDRHYLHQEYLPHDYYHLRLRVTVLLVTVLLVCCLRCVL